MRAKDAGMRCHCKVVLALVQGTTPTMIAQGGLCAKSQVYRVAERFITEGLAGLVDRREDNGERKITRVYESELLRLVEQSPQEFGYRRPTWTQELLILVLAERIEISISVSAMSRLLGRLRIGLKRPKPIVDCPWKKAHRTRRLRAIQRLVENLPADEVVLYVDEVDIHLNPKIGPDWTKRGQQKEVLTPGCNQKRYLAGAWNPKSRRLIYVGVRSPSRDLTVLVWCQADFPNFARSPSSRTNTPCRSPRVSPTICPTFATWLTGGEKSSPDVLMGTKVRGSTSTSIPSSPWPLIWVRPSSGGPSRRF
jgi:putative transposase